MRNFIGIALSICGLTAVFGGRAYHVACRSEWTEAQAFLAQWPVYLAGFAVAAIGVVILCWDDFV